MSENELIWLIKPICEPFDTVVLICTVDKLFPTNSNSTRPFAIPDNSTKLEAVALIPKLLRPVDRFSAICPAIIPLSKVTLALRPLAVVTETGPASCVRFVGKALEAYMETLLSIPSGKPAPDKEITSRPSVVFLVTLAPEKPSLDDVGK